MAVIDRELNKVLVYTQLPATFTLDDGQQQVFTPLISGTYTITEEALPNGWALSNITCDTGSWTPVLKNGQVSIDLTPGEDVSCEFHNYQGDVQYINLNIWFKVLDQLSRQPRPH